MDAAELRRADFWRALAPDLTIGQSHAAGEAAPVQTLKRIDRRMLKDGYFDEADDGLLALTPRIAQAVHRCAASGLPPVFVWLYDEPWNCFARLRPTLAHLLGADYRMLPDFWAWRVDPQKSESGWAPHVDRIKQDCLTAHGSPLSITCWIPLSDANPMNSCMYIVPASLDPFYNRPAARNALPRPETVRALPVKPGEYLIWNQAVLHWGGPSSEFAEAPRLSIAAEFQRGDIAPFNAPLLDGAPDFAMRLRLVGKQILQYVHMYGYSDDLIAVATQFTDSPAHT